MLGPATPKSRITFDPSVITYRDLLGVFFTITIHDAEPARRGRGNAVSVRGVHHCRAARSGHTVIDQLNRDKIWDDPIVTEVVEADRYFPAEDYHQDYYTENQDQPYCAVVIAPKVAKARKAYFDRLAK